ncbi:hypothetical protein [Fulvivirga lutea]|uniref:Uncharacterized protein n=1 Tax=Fulvivirga lutea TaxID=2810512 RepID=A0A974WG42_9BACT|nr:hypothetical protein [Fulvivirga lutea]QSE96968.1 hypothetical protein JR347_15420 [Fulvivirga lutea]
MKKSLLKLLAVLMLTGTLYSCSEEEINPSDDLNSKKTEGVTKDDGTF